MTSTAPNQGDAAHWAVYETALDIRHHAQDIITTTPIILSWADTLDKAITMTKLSEQLTREAVGVARAHGASWAEIDLALGTTGKAIVKNMRAVWA